MVANKMSFRVRTEDLKLVYLERRVGNLVSGLLALPHPLKGKRRCGLAGACGAHHALSLLTAGVALLILLCRGNQINTPQLRGP